MTSSPFVVLSISAASILLLSACSKPEIKTPPAIESGETQELTLPSPADIDLLAKLPKQLSAFNFFKDPTAQVPNEGVTPYAVNTEHFADYATVRRFFWVPTGEQITYDSATNFEFPLGSIILQTFSFPDATVPGGERLVETRLLMHAGEDGWIPTVYRWNDEMTDARRAVAGGLVKVTNPHDESPSQTMNYLIPNKNDCMRCHEDNNGMGHPNGFTARNLKHQNGQLSKWLEEGILKITPSEIAAFPKGIVWDDPSTGSTEERARYWLDVNCVHCHNPNGPGSVSGLDLSITQDNNMRLGMYKPPVAAGRGSEGFRFSIDPGSPNTSFVINRLRSTDPAVMMPPLGRMAANEEAVELISQWIAEIKFTEEEAQQLIVKQKELLRKLQEDGVWTEEK